MRLVSLLFATLMASSCSEYLKGKPYKTEYLEIKSYQKLACLDNLSSDIGKFLNSEGGDTEIDQTVNCINTTLTEIQTKVEGRIESTSFTADDVYNILSKFASSANISLTATQNLITLKAALLGGESTKITKNEIELLKKYLLVVKQEAKKLRPFIKLFYFDKTEKQHTKTYIKDAFDQLNISLKNLYQSSQLNSSAYSFDKFKELIINVLNLSEENKAMAEIMSKLSRIVGGNSSAALNEADRLKYIDNVTEILRQYSIYRNGYVKFEISTSATLDETLDFAENFLNLLENTVQYKNTKMISSQTIDGLITALTSSNVLTYKISAYTAAIFYRTIIVRVFESGAKGNILNFTGIKGIHLRNIRRELAIYKIYSKMLERVASEELFATKGILSAPLSDIQQALARLNIAAETEILNKFDLTLQTQIVNNVNDLRSEFTSTLPVIYRNNKVGVASNQNLWEQKWKDLARGFYVKMLARLIMQGWGQIYPFENINSNSLSELDLVNWYSEIKHMGIEMKSFDPRKYNSGPSLFNTTNLFTRVGNGDGKITFREITENLGIILSGSNTFTNEISTALTTSGCNLPELDIFDNHWKYESCFYDLLQINYKVYFSNMPHLVAYLNTKSVAEIKSYFDAALDVVRIDNVNKGNKIETSEILSMISLLHFIENLYVAHDANANGQISEAEIRQVYSKFVGVATNFAYANSRKQVEDFTSLQGDAAGYGCFSEQDLIRESFIFLIYNGRTPTRHDFNSFPCFRDKPLLYFPGEVDRAKIINSFKNLKSVLGV